MISKAIARFIRISPRKTRLVADVVRGKPIDEAQAILMSLEKRARNYIIQVLKSAIANAFVKDPDIAPSDLYISKITIDVGPTFKRYRAGSMGRAMMIKHRTSHILIELDKKQVAVKSKKPEGQGIKTKDSALIKAAADRQNPKTTDKKQKPVLEHKNKTKKVAAAKRGK